VVLTAWRLLSVAIFAAILSSPTWLVAIHSSPYRIRIAIFAKHLDEMSDEDRDVDIESDDEVDSPNRHSGSQFQTQAEKRAHHNALERKRRDHIKDSFSSLRDSIPALQGEKVKRQLDSSLQASTQASHSLAHQQGANFQASRAQILKKAADYIQLMRRKNSAHQQDIDDLKRQNNLLETQIKALEKARSTGNFNAVSMLDTTTSLITNARGDAVSAFDGGSGSESSESESSSHSRRKKMKTSSPTSSSGT
jgi:Max protein